MAFDKPLGVAVTVGVPTAPRVVRGPDPAFMGKARIVALWKARPRGELLACARQAIAGQPCGLHSPRGRASRTLRGITPGCNPGALSTLFPDCIRATKTHPPSNGCQAQSIRVQAITRASSRPPTAG
ncbi:hypothetical protein D3C72_1810010 [compost metagenome]